MTKITLINKTNYKIQNVMTKMNNTKKKAKINNMRVK